VAGRASFDRKKTRAVLETVWLIVFFLGATVVVGAKVRAPKCDPPVGMAAGAPGSETVEGDGIRDTAGTAQT
jgi:hypothetical protein